jgi:uracil-DNA glycosylase family 4
MDSSAADRVGALAAYHREHVINCERCPLHTTRTQVVLGSGDPNAAVMFVGEAPGYHEDLSGIPFVGQAGKLLDGLLAGIGLGREQVFVANVLKCRPPENRNPLPREIEACEAHLFRQVAIIRPTLVCTLGNFATKLLSGRPDGISKVHGAELKITLAGTPTILYPLYHPAAALYMPSMRATLEADFARIPELLDAMGLVVHPSEERHADPEAVSRAEAPVTPRPVTGAAAGADGQMGLF